MQEQNEKIIALLELASVFVADKTDCRHYLHDVFIDKLQDSINFVAVDGHKLIKININNSFFSEPLDLPERVNVQSIKNAVKIKDINVIKASNISLDVKYPEYNRLIPANNGFESMPRLNIMHLAQGFNAIAKCLKKFGCGKYPAIDFINLTDTNGNVFEADIYDTIKATMVIMPMRK